MNENNLNNVGRESRRPFRKRKRKYKREEMNEFEKRVRART
jgi:hypothetical protein